MSELSRVSTPSQRLPIIDELKGYAMCLVIYYHIGGILGWTNWLHGESGVDVFLLVSGFTLARSASEQSWGVFLKRRFFRIFPAYWVALALFYYLRTSLIGERHTALSVVLHILGVHAFAPGKYFSEYNDSFWFISLIVGLYLVFIVIKPYLKHVTAILGVGMALTTLANVCYLAANHGGGIVSVGGRIPAFFLGLVVGQIASGREVSWRISPLFALGSFSLMMLGWKTGIIPFYLVAGVAMASVFMVLANAARRWTLTGYLLKPFSFIGIYSYEIYLLHQPFIRDYTGVLSARYFHWGDARTELIKGIVYGLIATLVAAIALHESLNWLLKKRRREPTEALVATSGGPTLSQSQ